MIEEQLLIRKNALREYGFSDQEIEEHINKKRNALIAYKKAEDDNEKEEDSAVGGIRRYWNNVVDSVKESAVGEEFEVQKYWERGLGKSTLNLAKQYHTGNGILDINYETALEQEPEELNSGSVEGVNYNIYKDDTIFYYDSINEHIARTKLEMILEELGIKNIVSYPYDRSHDNIKVETTSGTVDGWRAQYTIPNKDLEEYFNTEE